MIIFSIIGSLCGIISLIWLIVKDVNRTNEDFKRMDKNRVKIEENYTSKTGELGKPKTRKSVPSPRPVVR